MEIWLVEDGKRTGPYQAYEVRERIERGEIDGETKAWHRDQKDWLPLEDMPAFATAFEEAVMVEAKGISSPPPLPSPTASWGEIWMRLAARWTDFVIYQIILMGGFLAFGRSPFAAIQSPWFLPAFVTILILFEAAALAVWGRTPGKWIAGMRIEAPDGRRPGVLASLGRCARLMVMGMGLWLPLMPILGHLIAAWYLRKRGVAPWDAPGTTVFKLPQIRAGRVVAIVGTLIVAYLVSSIIAFTAAMRWPDDLPPPYPEAIKELREELKKAKATDPGE